MESTSTLQNASPIPSRHLKVVTRHNLHVPEQGSKLTINTAFGSQILEVPEDRRGLRPRRVLSSIASSSDEQKKSQVLLNKIRESRSLDPFPLARNKLEASCEEKFLKPCRSTRSLENCDKCGEIQIFAIPEDKLINNNCPNGNVLNLPLEEAYCEEVDVPLLNTAQQVAIVRRRGGSGFDDVLPNNSSKRWVFYSTFSPNMITPFHRFCRWRSLESLPAGGNLPGDNQGKKKPSLKNWIFGFLNGNGLKASNTSLRKGVINEYNNLTEKESIV